MEARKPDRRMMREQMIERVVRLPRDLDQMIAKTGMARSGEHMETIEQQVTVSRQ
jgi:hypothetical protein